MARARDASRDGVLQRHQAVVVVIPQPAEHRGHAAQGGLRAGAAGFAQGDELGRVRLTALTVELSGAHAGVWAWHFVVHAPAPTRS